MAKVVFDVLGKEDCQNTLTWLLSGTSGRVKNSICRDFNIPYEEADKMSNNEIHKIASLKFDEVIQQETKFAIEYQKEWNKIEKDVFNIFTQIFDEELKETTLTAKLWPCYCCPYNKNGFWVQGLSYDWEKVKKTAIHEITHLYWWQKWDKTFANNPKMLERTYGSAIWYLSEIAVHTIANNSGLKDFLTNPNIANDGFYNVKIDNQDLFSKMDKLYKSCNSLEDFMAVGLEFVENNLMDIKTANNIVK